MLFVGSNLERLSERQNLISSILKGLLRIETAVLSTTIQFSFVERGRHAKE